MLLLYIAKEEKVGRNKRTGFLLLLYELRDCGHAISSERRNN